ncbi:MAG: histidine--tRNA ligase [Patescibacteria group bacterium]
MSKKLSKKDLLQTPKGTADILPHDVLRWEAVESKAAEIARFYGFQPMRTPHIEHAELFLPTLGETSDIVEKQMYSFRTRGGDQLVLRPEWTVPAVRAYFEHGMQAWPQPVMLYQAGSFFRHESPQRGRWREFGQFDLEILGEETAIADALIIRVLSLIFEELGLKNFLIHLNSLGDKECRPEYRRELASYYRRKFNSLCKDCKRRLKTNPLRLLDCKEPICGELKAEAPKMIDFACEACRGHFKGLLEFLDDMKVPYFLDPYLVRGLDYYSRTVFEIFVKEPAETPNNPAESGKDGGLNPEKKIQPIAIASGGRYDYLAESLGQKAVFGVGGAIGLDRLLDAFKISQTKILKEKKPNLFLIQLGIQGKKKSLILFEILRRAKFNIGQSLAKDNLRAQLQSADKAGASVVLIIGQKEAMDGTIIVRDMSAGTQETVLEAKIIDYLKKKLSPKANPHRAGENKNV